MHDEININDIRLDGGTQPRSGLDDNHVGEIAADMDAGEELPPIQVVFDGEHYWPWDGFHRIAAAKRLDHGHIAAEVRQGTRRDAVLLSVGANAEHNSLRRTNDDKRRAVMTLLGDDEWSAWSDRKIAELARVSQPFVGKLRPASSDNGYQMRTVERNGTTYQQNTAGINAGRAAAEKPAAPAPTARITTTTVTETVDVDTDTGEIVDVTEQRTLPTATEPPAELQQLPIAGRPALQPRGRSSLVTITLSRDATAMAYSLIEHFDKQLIRGVVAELTRLINQEAA